MKVIIINGPNLNLLGKREPEIYGTKTFETYFSELKTKFPSIELEYFQSNVEGELINKLHEVGFTPDYAEASSGRYAGIILNAGGYTHTSVALGDAVASIKTKVIEVHISNIFAREEFRHVSLISKHAVGIISGFGLKGYEMALDFLNQ